MNIKTTVFKNLSALVLIIGCNCTHLFAITFTVNDNTWQNTPGSLLYCINQANSSAGPHIINFDPAGAPYIITPSTSINLNQFITIDGASSGQIVTLIGTNLLNKRGISVNASGASSIIRGLFMTQYKVQAASLSLSKDTLCLGENVKITLSNHLGLNLQLQYSSNPSGTWTNVDAIKTRFDSVWEFTPDKISETYYRVLSSAPNWEIDGSNSTYRETSEIVKLTIFGVPDLIITNPDALCKPNKINLTAASVTAGSTGIGTLSYWTDANAISPYGNPSAADNGTYYIKAENTSYATCSAIKPVFANLKNIPTIDNIDTKDISNCTENNGSIKIYANGPDGSVEYSIDGGKYYQSDSYFTNLGIGNYEVSVRYIDFRCEVKHAPILLKSPNTPILASVIATNPSNCNGNDASITINAIGTKTFEYSINGTTFQSSPIFKNLTTGVYKPSIRYTDKTCAKEYGSLFITDPNPTDFNARGRATSCAGISGKLIFDGNLIHSKTYTISFLDKNNLVETRTLSSENNAFEIGPYPSGFYRDFSLTDDRNCTSTYTFPVEIGIIDTCPPLPLKAPNVFTANGDGYNETFEIFGLSDYAHTQVFIFDRWGKAVYHTSSDYVSNPWDGGKYPEGAYFFVIEYGTEETNKKKHTGVVHLIR